MKVKRHMMRKFRYIIPVMLLLSLVSCGSVKSANDLYKQAKKKHGKCTVVSKDETEDKTTVVLHDELQDFDYTVTSSMDEINIDGSSFGSVPDTSDSFDRDLKEKVLSDCMSDIEDACSSVGVSYQLSDYALLVVKSSDEDKAVKGAKKCAKILQKKNKKHRMDGWEIEVRGKTESNSNYTYDDKYGVVRLPDNEYADIGDLKVEYYTEMAHSQTDPKATYVRKEKKTFADTGADLERVVNVLGEDYPTSNSSPVTFYYFKDSNGREYYLCDFNYYESNSSRFAWYTNY